jgi:hypothetical protein
MFMFFYLLIFVPEIHLKEVIEEHRVNTKGLSLKDDSW